jgi:hypothetical protein
MPSTSDESPTTLPNQLGPRNVHPISHTCFVDPVTPQTLEAALEIKEMRKGDDEDLFDGELAVDTWVLSLALYVI